MTHYPTITVLPPWGSLIARGRKTIETRTHPNFARQIVGRTIAIHQGLTWTKTYMQAMEAIGVCPTLDDLNHAHRFAGAIVAVADCLSCDRLIDDDPWPNAFACSRCSDRLFGYDLANVRPLSKPVFVRGQQGVWMVRRADVDRFLLPAVPFIPHETVRGGRLC